MPPQIKVRLEVDGTPEAIAAVRAFTAQTKQAGREASKAFAPLGATFGGVRGLLGNLGIAIGTAELIRFGKGTLEAADNVNRLAQEVGTTAAFMSTLSVTARLANVEQAKMVSSLGELGKAIDRLKAGEPTMVAAFARIKLTAKDFPGDDIAVAADTVAHAMDRYSGGLTKAAIASAIAGKNGRALIPIYSELVKLGGIQGALAVAKSQPFFVDDADVAQVEALSRQMQMLQLYVQGAGLEFLKGFGPQALASMDDLTSSTGKLSSNMKDFGEFVGGVLRAVTAIFVTVGTVFGELIAQIVNMVNFVRTAGDDLVHGRFDRLGADAKQFLEDYQFSIRTGAEKVRDAWIDVFKSPAAPVAGARDKGRAPGPRAPRDTSLDAAEKQLLEARHARVLAELKRQEQLQQEQYDRGLISLRAYYDARRQAAEDGLAAETAVLAGERGAALSEKDAAKRATLLKINDEKVAAAQINLAREKASLDSEEAKRREELDLRVAEGLAKLGTAREQEHQRELARIEAERVALEKDLVLYGYSTERAKEEAQAAADAQLATLHATEAAATLEGQLRHGAFDAMGQFFGSGINQARDFADALRLAVIQLAAMAQQMIAMHFFAGVESTLFPGVKKAAGGFIWGPGSSTSDSIPALLSRGEFVMPARTVAMTGMREYLEALRTNPELIHGGNFHLREVNGYADGGLVQPSAPGSATVGGEITISLDEGVILKAMESRAGQDVLIKVMAKNRRSIGRALGG